MEETISIVLPVSFTDFPRVIILLESLHQNLNYKAINRFYIVTTEDLFNNRIFTFILEYYKNLKIELINELEFIPILNNKTYDPYTIQQIIKFKIIEKVKTPFYLLLDADVILANKCNYEDLISLSENKIKARGCKHSDNNYMIINNFTNYTWCHTIWLKKSLEILGIEKPNKLFWGVTPMIFSVNIVKSIKLKIETLYKKDWIEYLINNTGWSGYTLYFSWASYSKLDKYYHIDLPIVGYFENTNKKNLVYLPQKELFVVIQSSHNKNLKDLKEYVLNILKDNLRFLFLERKFTYKFLDNEKLSIVNNLLKKKKISIISFSLCLDLFNICENADIIIPPIKEYYLIMKHIYKNKIVNKINSKNDLIIYYDLDYIRNLDVLKKYISVYKVLYVIIKGVLINSKLDFLQNIYKINYSQDNEIIDLHYIYNILKKHGIGYKIIYFKNNINPISDIILTENINTMNNFDDYFEIYEKSNNKIFNPKIYLYNKFYYEEQEPVYIRDIILKGEENIEIQFPKKIKDYSLINYQNKDKLTIDFKNYTLNIKSTYSNETIRFKIVIYSEEYYIQQEKLETIKYIKSDTHNLIQTNDYFMIICRKIKNFYKIKQYLISIMRYVPEDYGIINFEYKKNALFFKKLVNNDKCITKDSVILIIKNKETLNKYLENNTDISIYRNIIPFEY